DWLRAPVDVDELRIRVANLRARAHEHGAVAKLDADGILHYRGRLVTLPPVQQRLAELLLERTGSVVSRPALVRRGRPDGAPGNRTVLDVHVTRLRRLFAEVGLQLTTVRRRGYLFHSPPESGAATR